MDFRTNSRTDERMDGVLYIDARTHLKEMGFIVNRSTDGSMDRQPLIDPPMGE